MVIIFVMMLNYSCKHIIGIGCWSQEPRPWFKYASKILECLYFSVQNLRNTIGPCCHRKCVQAFLNIMHEQSLAAVCWGSIPSLWTTVLAIQVSHVIFRESDVKFYLLCWTELHCELCWTAFVSLFSFPSWSLYVANRKNETHVNLY